MNFFSWFYHNSTILAFYQRHQVLQDEETLAMVLCIENDGMCETKSRDVSETQVQNEMNGWRFFLRLLSVTEGR